VEQDGRVEGRLGLPGWSPVGGLAEAQPVVGHLGLALPNLDLVAAWVPALQALQGTVDADITLAGSLGEPDIEGQAHLRDASVELPDLGIRVHDIALAMHSGDTHFLQYSGNATSGDGTLKLSGRTELRPAQGWPTVIEVKGEDFEVVDISQARVVVSPSLEARLQGRRMDLQGDVLGSAAGTLGIAGGDLLAKQIGASIGLHEVRVRSGETPEQASLLLGRYLSPKLYVQYATGLFVPSHEVMVRYHVTPKVHVQTQTGAAHGADIFYRIER